MSRPTRSASRRRTSEAAATDPLRRVAWVLARAHGGRGDGDPGCRRTRRTQAPGSIRVGGIADVELFRGAEVGARARFTAVNAEGGIDGVPIELVGVADDQRDPSVARNEVRRLVEQEQVEALVPVVTSRFTDDGTLADARIPAFGWGIASGFCGNRWAFGITGCLAPLLPERVPTIWGVLVAEVLQARGVTDPTVAFVTERGALPRTLRELRAVAKAADLRVVDARADLGTGDGAAVGATESAAAVAGGDAPPDAVFTVASFAAVGAFQDALRAQGYAGVMTNLVQYGPSLAGPANGAFVLTQFATPESRVVQPGDAAHRPGDRRGDDGRHHARDAGRLALGRRVRACPCAPRASTRRPPPSLVPRRRCASGCRRRSVRPTSPKPSCAPPRAGSS